MSGVLDEVAAERQRQDAKRGQQNHDDHNATLHRVRHLQPQRVAATYEIPTAERARSLCQEAFKRGEGSWSAILIEEVAEAIGAIPSSDLRAELIQVAAVAVAWIEAIDRRRPAPEPEEARP